MTVFSQIFLSVNHLWLFHGLSYNEANNAIALHKLLGFLLRECHFVACKGRNCEKYMFSQLI